MQLADRRPRLHQKLSCLHPFSCVMNCEPALLTRSPLSCRPRGVPCSTVDSFDFSNTLAPSPTSFPPVLADLPRWPPRQQPHHRWAGQLPTRGALWPAVMHGALSGFEGAFRDFYSFGPRFGSYGSPESSPPPTCISRTLPRHVGQLWALLSQWSMQSLQQQVVFWHQMHVQARSRNEYTTPVLHCYTDHHANTAAWWK